jgi:hypothetical protein
VNDTATLGAQVDDTTSAILREKMTRVQEQLVLLTRRVAELEVMLCAMHEHLQAQ